jgi:hypothetical protein
MKKRVMITDQAVGVPSVQLRTVVNLTVSMRKNSQLREFSHAISYASASVPAPQSPASPILFCGRTAEARAVGVQHDSAQPTALGVLQHVEQPVGLAQGDSTRLA